MELKEIHFSNRRKVGRPRIYGEDYVWQDEALVIDDGLSPTQVRREKKRFYSRKNRHLKLTSAEADE